MYIEPNSTIKLLRNVPMNSTYEGTMWFPDKGQQEGYFIGKEKYTLENHSYQRYEDGSIMVELPIANVLDVNYIQFKNTSYENKWFYAFVTNIEYESNNVTRLDYELDVMQTWMFNWEFADCFIEREHVNSDEYYEHTLPETYPIGDMVERTHYNIGVDVKYIAFVGHIIIRARWDDEDNEVKYVTTSLWGIDKPLTPLTADNFITHVAVSYFKYQTESEREFVAELIEKLAEDTSSSGFKDGIYGIYLVGNVPEMILEQEPYYNVGGELLYTMDRYVNPKGFTNHVFTVPIDLPGYYVPRNNKVYSSQFVELQLKMRGGRGGTINQNITHLRGGKNVVLSVQGGVENLAGYRVTPLPTDGYVDTNLSFDTGGLTLTPLSKSNVQEVILGVATSAISTALSYTSIPSMGTSTWVKTGQNKGDIRNTLTTDTKKPHTRTTETTHRSYTRDYTSSGTRETVGSQPGLTPLKSMVNMVGEPIRGNSAPIGSSSSFELDAYNGATIGVVSVSTPSHNDVVALDNYFNVFGYTVNRIGKPNTNTRQRWNYVKTRWCTLKNTTCPDFFIDDIKAIFNNGIVLWSFEGYTGTYIDSSGYPLDNGVIE